MKVVRATLVAFTALLMAAPTVAQTGYPDRPVRIIVGFTAGSATDITARMFAQKLNAAWNVPVTVENIPGAGGSVGGDRVAKAAPDGTTLYWGANGAMTINPSLLPNPTFDTVRDLAPIARVLVMPSLLVVNNDVPAKSVAELFALAKARPGQLSYASPGVGTPQHIAGELLKSLAGVDIVHVPYRGVALADVIGGRVTMTTAEHGRDTAGRARRQAARARRHLQPAFADHSRTADARRIRFSGLRSHLLVRASGAGQHGSPDHRQGA
jgi:tripartite-type tricarboxylate transporter receptor subunit TctC